MGRRQIISIPLVACWLALSTGQVDADEGMYPISEIGRLPLADHGLEMDPEDLFNPDKTCLVDGICRVNGCTGSFVSPRGLILTNHHCAYRAIQSASSAESDFLRDGFLARSLGEELPAKGYTVRITEGYSDVSEQVLSVLETDMDFAERTKAIERRRKELEKEAEEENPGMRAEVAEMFAGKSYVLFLYTYLRDVRLVFAPPASVGAFGGDIDNWEWPRHTGDFSFMRAYVAPDGSSAEYSPDNVPYEPKRHIQVARQGVSEEDFVFLLGYPGRTARHKTSTFLNYEENVRLPFVVDLYQWQIDLMSEMGKDDRSVELKHTSRSKSLANVEKRSRGQLKGLRRANIAANRAADEQRLQEFIDADPQRQQRYGHLLGEIAAVYEEMTATADYELNMQHLRSACRVMSFAFLIYDSAVEREKDDLERETPYMDRNFDQTVQRLMLSVRDLHEPTDRLMMRGMLERLAQVDNAGQIPTLGKALSDPSQFDSVVSLLFDNTRLVDEETVQQHLEMSPEELRKSEDPFLQLAIALYPEYLRLRELDKARDGRLAPLYGLLIEVKQQFLDADFVPDANGTLRMTFGNIRGYSPEDAVYKRPITSLTGVIDKTTGEEPFVTPQRIVDLHRARDFGAFVHPDLNDVPVGILYNTDTTGGNSGSPILNARGELVGVNFDRAFEATINDFAWNENYSRSIGVDVRYALWITDKVYGANHLIAEMGVR